MIRHAEPSQAGPSPSLVRIVLPFTPTAKKNRQRIVRFKKGGKFVHGIRASAKAETQQATIAAIIRSQLTAQGMRLGDGPLFGDDEIEVRFVRLVEFDRVVIEVRSLGPRPTGRTGRDRDVPNLAESFCDAGNGVLWDDDRQIRKLFIERRLRNDPDRATIPPNSMEAQTS